MRLSRPLSLATHGLRVEGCSGWRTGHLYDRKGVPFTAADHGGVDVDVRPSLEFVAPERQRP